jgi:hypothetical protein
MKKRSEATPARDSHESTEASTDAPSDEASALTLVRPIAIFAVVVVLLGRAFGPSLRGLAVGLGKLAERIEMTGAILSQAFLILGTITSLGLVLSILRTPVAGLLRFVVISGGGLVTLATLLSMATRMPEGTLLLSASLTCLLALAAAWSTRRIPFARASSIILGFIGIGSVMRIIAILIAAQERAPNRHTARHFSTIGLIMDGLAMAVAVGFVSSSNRKRSLSSPTTFVALGAALIAMRLAIGGASEEAGMASVLFDRAARALSMRPEPWGSPALVSFFAFAAPFLAIAVLSTPTLTPALSGAIALALLAHGAPDVPLCGLMLAIASVATILASRDHRGIWAAIKRDEPSGSVSATDAAKISPRDS